MVSSDSGLSTLFHQVVSEYPVGQIGEGLSDHPVRDIVENHLSQRIRELLDDARLVIESSAGKGRWTSIPWIAVMDSRETDQIQEGVYVVYLFEPQEERVRLTLNQGVTYLKNEHGTAAARKQLRTTADQIRRSIELDGFAEGPLEFPHASSRNKLYGPGTIYFKEYPLDGMPDDEELAQDLQALVESYQQYVSTHSNMNSPDISQAPVRVDGGPVRANYEQTVLEGVPRTRLEGICEIPVEYETVRVFGNHAEEAINEGDYLIFADREGHAGGEYSILARVEHAIILDHATAEEFADAVGWEPTTDGVFSHVMFLEPLYEADLDRKWFWDLMEYKGWPNYTHSAVNFDRNGSTFFDEYDSVDEFIEDIKGKQLYPVETDSFEERIDALLRAEHDQAHLYRQALAHLVAGKNIVFYGPPGTGKTRAARLLTEATCASASLVTANAEWSNYQVVGGYQPAGSAWESSPGFLTEAAQACTESLRQSPSRPSWLIIDELNRANLDEAFGDVFTLLDLDYRTTEPLTYANIDVFVPLSFRILATMNTYDQAQLFSLGYAFRRRFAFVEVPSLLSARQSAEWSREIDLSSVEIPELDKTHQNLVSLVREAAIDAMTVGNDGDGVCEDDVATIVPEYATRDAVTRAHNKLDDNDALRTDGLSPVETLVYFATEIAKRDVIDIGQALLIDITKYLIAHQLLFSDETTRSTLDDAIVAYIVPQFEHFMSDLRRAETVDRDSDAAERFDQIVQLAKDLDFPRTAAVLEEAAESKRILS